MPHLLTLLIVPFTYGAAAFPPRKDPSATAPAGTVDILAVYFVKEFPFVDWYITGDIPYDVDADENVLKLDSSNENFIAFAKTFDLDVEDWTRIRYNHVDNRFILLYRVRCYVLYTFSWPPR
ncbi:hypothetical protein FOZ63_029743 [Perkinsus olseni]|uniref:Uncharacterized protein n=1 Tax=Perkinsus olseni TaxID=32597 RepID=A0A7J6TEQ6_PEROL|nr:hypothetical protein FOZ60_003754 [Perkinsus olseni]KAF4726434.1 hypothetical protein FOZ62_026965 [Perkinsus olseni]KAF4742850.1 hypothetical protein FOZ63_029743 [Perkinsus olseni]